MRHPHRGALVVVMAIALAACENTPTATKPGVTYSLDAIDGVPAPFTTDTTYLGNRTFYDRITARSIDIVSADSADYAWVTDEVEYTPIDGGLQPVRVDCMQVRIPWRRVGDQVLLDFSDLPVPPGPPVDTLRVSGRRLLQRLAGDASREYRLSYREVAESPNLCQVTR